MEKSNNAPIFVNAFAAILLTGWFTSSHAAPPALTTSSFMKHDVSFENCQIKSKEIMSKMNLEVEDHGNGTIGGFGEQSVAVVNCHLMDKATYIQVAVSSQKEESAETIMHYLVSYLKTNPTQPPALAPAQPTIPSVSAAKPSYSLTTN